jgi:hypothetical protein
MKHQIYNLRFPSQYLMTSTFMRVAEFYESPRFRGQVFTHEEYMDWYAHKRGSMSYFTDWGGFNLPSRVIADFATLFHPMSDKERKLINLLRRSIEGQGTYYLVATCDKDKRILAHEIVHGLYTLYPKYALDVGLVLGEHEHELDPQRATLLKIGYGASVMDDEINAYAVTGLPRGMKKFSKAQDKLTKLVEKHFGVKINTREGMKKLFQSIHTLDWGVGEPVPRP